MDFTQQIIDTFRAHGGEVREPIDFGKGLGLLHISKKDGSDRVVPLAALEADGAWHVVGSAGGRPEHPAWVHNLRRVEAIDLEVPGDPIRTVRVAVTELTGAERDELWELFKQRSPAFAQYETTAQGRVFPIFRLTP